MFRQPPLVQLYAGILTFLVVVTSILAPHGWTMLLPPPAGAALWLREARVVWRNDACASMNIDAWQAIADSPRPGYWFGAVAQDAFTASARVYGLTGLGAFDRGALDSALAALPPAALADTALVIDSEFDGKRLPLAALVPEIRDGSLARHFADRRTRPEC